MKFRLASIVLAVTILAPGDALAQRGFESMDVFDLEYASDPQISPDGSLVAYVRNSMDVMEDRRETSIWIVSSDGYDHRFVTDGSTPRWSPDGGRLAYLRDGQIHVRWMDTGEHTTLTRVTESPAGIRWSPDGDNIAFTMLVRAEAPVLATLPEAPEGATWADPPQYVDRYVHRADGRGDLPHGFTHLFVVPAEGGTPKQVTTGDYDHSRPPAWMPDGERLVFAANRSPDWETDRVESNLYVASLAAGTIQQLTNGNGPEHSPAVSPEGDRIAYLGYEDRQRTYQVTQLFVMSADGGARTALTTSIDRSISSPIWAGDGRGIFFHYEDEGATKVGYTALDGTLWVLADDLGGTSYGRPYGGGSFSVSEDDEFAYTVTDASRPADVGIGNREGEVRRITDLNEDAFDGIEMATVEELWWQSSHDGREIQGWIVKPPGFDPERTYPLILEIHGGPISNYGPRFSAEVQLYAAAGYVVLYANPRGSTGYGEEFGDLLHHNYPGEDYDDLMSGVDALLAFGYVDPENLFVTGGSAGGIMTAWIVGKTDRFRAAVAVKPVINWISKTLVADNWYAYHEYRYPGSPWENPDEYLRFSPLSLVGNVSTPTLLMAGDQDLRTPLSEADQFYHALKYRGVDTGLVRIPGASHNIVARPSQLIAKVSHVLAWFERYRTTGNVTNQAPDDASGGTR